MTTRIRYETFEDDKGKYDLVSCRNFHSPYQDNMYIVYIDSKNCEYKIRNMSPRGREYKGGDGVNNMQVLKRNIKAHLKKLGVPFESKEIRDNSSRIKGVNCGYGSKETEEIK